MRRFFPFVLCLVGLAFCAEGQITSYPYIQDFENFTILQTTGSCLTPGGMNADGWSQLTTDDGDWRSDTAGTGSVGTGPGSTSTTNGVGIGTDVNPGTGLGHYLYTEASGCPNAEIGLLSPVFDFSATDTFYKLTFYYHMFGDGIGSLHIDVADGSVWTNSVWVQVGQVDSNWNMAEISLANYRSDSIRIRIRGITGSNFRSDICIDDIRVFSFTPPSYDALIVEFSNDAKEYPIRPLAQYDSVAFDLRIFNEGIKDATGTEINITEGSFSSNINVGDLASFESQNVSSSLSYWPQTVGTIDFQAVVSITENDSFPSNDTAYTSIVVSDSVLARENSNSNAGIGFNATPGMLAQLFHLINPDTVTSFTFKAQGLAGDTARVHIYAYDTAAGALIVSTDYLVLTGNRQWYTLGLNCAEVLDTGTYLVALEQVSASNIGLSMDIPGFTPQSAFFRADGVADWTPVEDGGFDVCYILRMNFGETAAAISIVTDSVCEGSSFSVTASGAGTYSWSPAASFSNPQIGQTFCTLQSSTEIQLIVTNACGIKDTARRQINVEKGPTASTSKDTTVCVGDQANLRVNSNNMYQWENGPSNADFNALINASKSYKVTVDSTNGCSKVLFVDVTASEASITAFGDSTLCSGETAPLSATGAKTYQWQNGPADSIYYHIASITGYIRVAGYNEFGCEAIDSVYLTVIKGPELNLLQDTGACFTDSLYLVASGVADSVYWLNETSDSVLKLRVVKSADYIAVGESANGCTDHDTVHVEVYIPPFAVVDEDTTICEGQTANLSASGGDLYEWSNGETTSTISVSPTMAQHFKVIVSSVNGCTDEDSIYVDIDPLPIASFSFATFVDSVQFTDGSQYGDHYHWDFADGDSSLSLNPHHIYDSSGTYKVILTVSNHCGSRDTSIDVVVTIPTGVIHTDLRLLGLKLYPNPATQLSNLELKNDIIGEGEVRVFNDLGQIVLKQSIEKSARKLDVPLDVRSLPQGAYWIEVRLNSSYAGLQLIKLD
ncbi:MAG: PKD domain-containing protein [Bacteroidia bacterium]